MTDETIQKRPFKGAAASLASAYRQAKTVIKRQDILFALCLVNAAADGAVDPGSMRLLGQAREIQGMKYTPRKDENDDETPEPDFESVISVLETIAILWAEHPEAISVTLIPSDDGSYHLALSVHPDDVPRFWTDQQDEGSFMWVVTELLNRLAKRLNLEIENVVVDILKLDISGTDDSDSDYDTATSDDSQYGSESKASHFRRVLTKP